MIKLVPHDTDKIINDISDASFKAGVVVGIVCGVSLCLVLWTVFG